MSKKSINISTWLLLFDLFIIIVCLVLSSLYSISPSVSRRPNLSLNEIPIIRLFLFTGIVWIIGSRNFGVYDDVLTASLDYQIVQVIKNVVVESLSLVMILFLTKEHVLTRTFVVAFSFLLALALVLSRVVFIRGMRSFSKRLLPTHKTIIVGLGSVQKDDLVSALRAFERGREIVGFVGDHDENIVETSLLGRLKELPDVVASHGINEAIIFVAEHDPAAFETVIEACENQMIDIRVVRSYDDMLPRRFRHVYLPGFPFVVIETSRSNEFPWRILKRLLDVVVSVAVGVLIMPWLIPVIVLLQKIGNPGPVFYRSERIGFKGGRFVMFKFRTMRENEVKEDGSLQYEVARPDDPRTTVVGKFLRRTNLDEIPQFLNVLKGDMSLVGPRPLDYLEVEKLKDHVGKLMLRHYVKPGITGWAQVNGLRGGTENIVLMQKRISFDLWYISNWSLGLDLQIVLMTILKVVTRDPNAY